MAKYPDIHDVVNTDSPIHWTETLRLSNKQKERLKEHMEWYEKWYAEFLEEAAQICGLDSNDWKRGDWWDLEEILNDYK